MQKVIQGIAENFGIGGWICGGLSVLALIAVLYGTYGYIIVPFGDWLRVQWFRQGRLRFLTVLGVVLVTPLIIWLCWGFIFQHFWVIIGVLLGVLLPVSIVGHMAWDATHESGRTFIAVVAAACAIMAISMFFGWESGWTWLACLATTCGIVVLPAWVWSVGYRAGWGRVRLTVTPILVVLLAVSVAIAGTWGFKKLFGYVGGNLVASKDEKKATEDKDSWDKAKADASKGKFAGQPEDRGPKVVVEDELLNTATSLCNEAYPLLLLIERSRKALWKAEDDKVLIPGFKELGIHDDAYTAWCSRYRSQSLLSSKDVAHYMGLVTNIRQLSKFQESREADKKVIIVIIDKVGGDGCLDFGYMFGETARKRPEPGNSKLEIMAGHCSALWGRVKTRPGYKAPPDD